MRNAPVLERPEYNYSRADSGRAASVTFMKPWGIVALTAAVLAAGTTAYFVTRPEGDWRTDAHAERAAQCLTRHPTARAHGFDLSCGDWEVVEDATLADRLADPDKTSKRMVIRIHYDALQAGFNYDPAITACYRMYFNYYGLSGGPSRVHCPAGAPN